MPQPFKRAGIHRLAQEELGCDDVADAALAEFGQELAAWCAVLDRIPGGEHPGAEAGLPECQASRKFGEFLRVFEGWIDQNKSPPMPRRQQRSQRLPGIAMMHSDLPVIARRADVTPQRRRDAVRSMPVGHRVAAAPLMIAGEPGYRPNERTRPT